ncbi:MAG: UDP-N-acetylmuramate dehydrogenase [bacterium]|nr:UDP-N-acetylmuramate dehydrogenase [bacterium]MDZ4284453.1 UDP-N-acetylmuramate dehydrogenase [Patescibacteria group bacterium]
MRHEIDESLIVERDVTLAPRTTFRVGGTADFFCAVRDEGELARAVRFARERDLAITILGGGSNVVVRDEGVRGLVIAMALRGRSFRRREGGAIEVRAAAGEVWDGLVLEAVARELWGIENLSGIPGLVGATPIQNVGAYGAEVGSRIVSVEAFDTEGMVARVFNADECAFCYRDSFFKTKEGKRFIITAVTYRLDVEGAPDISYRDLSEYFAQRRVAPTLSSMREAVLTIRRAKFPDIDRVGTAGSFFKNPVIGAERYSQLKLAYPTMPAHEAGAGLRKVPAAWLIEHVARMRGVRDGAVGSSGHHALAIVNYSSARASDILAFAARIQDAVSRATGITLEPEVQVL